MATIAPRLLTLLLAPLFADSVANLDASPHVDPARRPNVGPAAGPVAGPAAATDEIEQALEDGRVEVFEVRPGPDGSPVRHGAYERRYADGSRECVGTYADGDESGRWKFYWPGDRGLLAAGPMGQGKPRGKWRFKFPEDDRGRAAEAAEGRFDGGHRVGDWTFQDAAGDVDPRRSGAVEAVVDRWPSGVLRTVGTRVEGRPDGLWTAWWPNGRPAVRGFFEGGTPVGEWRAWHPDGFEDPLLQRRDWSDPDRQLLAEWIDRWRPDQLEQRAASPAVPGTFDDVVASAAACLAEVPLELLPSGWPEGPAAAGDRSSALEAAVADGLKHGTFAPRDRRALAALVLNEAVRHAATETSPLPAPLLGAVSNAVGNADLLGLHIDGDEPIGSEPLRRALGRLATVLFLAGDSRDFWFFDRDLLRFGPAELPPLVGRDRTTIWIAPHFAAPAIEPVAESKPRRKSRRSDRDAVEVAVARAVAWLLEHQSDDGRWGAEDFDAECASGPPLATGSGSPHRDVGVTALALLALHDAGVRAGTEGPGLAVAKGLRWLCGEQSLETGWIGETVVTNHIYSHAAATAALARHAPSVASDRIQLATRWAVELLESTREPYSGWSYSNADRGPERTTAVTGWSIWALLEADRAGFEVDSNAYHGALSLLFECTDMATGRVGYRNADEGSSRLASVRDFFSGVDSEALTALALVVRGGAVERGVETPESVVDRGFERLGLLLPEWSDDGSTNDLFYWRFGATAVGAAGERRPKVHRQWSSALHAALLRSQRTEPPCFEGSWDANGPWAGQGGRVYSTAMALSALVEIGRHGEP